MLFFKDKYMVTQPNVANLVLKYKFMLCRQAFQFQIVEPHTTGQLSFVSHLHKTAKALIFN